MTKKIQVLVKKTRVKEKISIKDLYNNYLLKDLTLSCEIIK